MYPYPPSLPTEEIGVLLGVLRGSGALTDPKDVHAGWVLLGFGASKLMPDSPVPTVAADHGAMAMHLEAGLTSGLFNWQSVLAIVAKLIAAWVASQVK